MNPPAEPATSRDDPETFVDENAVASAPPSASVSARGDVSQNEVERAIGVLQADGLVAFPTETVWGLAARARSEVAVERLRRWKGIGWVRPFSVMVSGLAQLEAELPVLAEPARGLALRHWPGPLTLIVHCDLALAPGVATDTGATGFRCSPHPVAAALIRAAELHGLGPLTATSLNETGEASAETREYAEQLLRDRPGVAMLMSGEAGGAAASTVVDVTGPRPKVLREGAIPKIELGIQ